MTRLRTVKGIIVNAIVATCGYINVVGATVPVQIVITRTIKKCICPAKATSNNQPGIDDCYVIGLVRDAVVVPNRLVVIDEIKRFHLIPIASCITRIIVRVSRQQLAVRAATCAVEVLIGGRHSSSGPQVDCRVSVGTRRV